MEGCSFGLFPIASLLKLVITEIVSCNLLFYENNIFNLSININYVIDIGVCIIIVIYWQEWAH